jgi:hypothetical protein
VPYTIWKCDSLSNFTVIFRSLYCDLQVRQLPEEVNKDQPAWIEAALPGAPALTPAGDIGAGLLKSKQRFFEPQPSAPQEHPYRVVRHLHPEPRQLRFQPMQRQVWCLKRRCAMKARCGSSNRLRCPPILPGATEPVVR